MFISANFSSFQFKYTSSQVQGHKPPSYEHRTHDHIDISFEEGTFDSVMGGKQIGRDPVHNRFFKPEGGLRSAGQIPGTKIRQPGHHKPHGQAPAAQILETLIDLLHAMRQQA